jgi:hypothetical protein
MSSFRADASVSMGCGAAKTSSKIWYGVRSAKGRNVRANLVDHIEGVLDGGFRDRAQVVGQ